MVQMIQKFYLPILFLLAWLVFTILVFIFGPYAYEISNKFFFYLYLTVIHIALLLGYLRGQKSRGRGSIVRINYIKFIKWAVLISVFYNLFKILFTLGGDLSNISQTFSNSAQSYSSSSLRFPHAFNYIDIFFHPIYLIAVTNSVFYYNFLERRYRTLLWFLVLLAFGYSIGSATRGGMVQLSIMILGAFMLAIYKGNIILTYRIKLRIAIVASLFLVGFTAYTSLLHHTRGGAIFVNPLTDLPPKESYLFSSVIPEKLEPVANHIAFYVSHSYYRLNRAMELPFKGLGFGLSNSYFIMDNIESLTGWSGLKNISYGMRLDMIDGGVYGLFWSTFYTWIASDFTFPGTIVIIFFIGYFFSIALKDSLYTLNPISVTVFCALLYFIFHFPFNNPLQEGGGLSTYLVLPLIWYLMRKKNP